MPYELPPDPRAERRTRVTRWLSFLLAAALVVLVVYFGYIGFEGSRQLTEPPTSSADCRTPDAFGWSYEAINYDVSTDAALAAEPDREACSAQGAPAGEALTGGGGIGLAGWYIPSGAGSGPAGPTVILAHGWGSNKSDMLERAAPLHGAYNLVLFDFRNHGQSGEAASTQGVREASDVRAVIDWLIEAKGPDRIAVLGVSMGGASTLAEAERDERVDAVIVESTHATLANAVQSRLDRAGYPLSMPGSWAVLLGTLIRTGEDVSAADPVQAIGRLDERPVMIISAGADDSIGPDDADQLLAAAQEAGSPAELHVCPDAGHARSNEVCAEDYAGWVLGFLQRHLAPAG
ncbi:MAG: alpha/beta hydrolase [Candidatus Limnocylindria bacterium]